MEFFRDVRFVLKFLELVYPLNFVFFFVELKQEVFYVFFGQQELVFAISIFLAIQRFKPEEIPLSFAKFLNSARERRSTC